MPQRIMPQRRQEPQPPSAERRRSVIEDGLSTPPKQLHRGASPAFMRWILEEFKELARKEGKVGFDSISTHDLTMGAKWDKARQNKDGYGYGAPTTKACIRALTMEARTSVYEFIAGEQNFLSEVAQELRSIMRDKLAKKFGDDWQTEVRAALGMRLADPFPYPYPNRVTVLRYRDTFCIARVGMLVRWADRGDRRDRGDRWNARAFRLVRHHRDQPGN